MVPRTLDVQGEVPPANHQVSGDSGYLGLSMSPGDSGSTRQMQYKCSTCALCEVVPFTESVAPEPPMSWILEALGQHSGRAHTCPMIDIVDIFSLGIIVRDSQSFLRAGASEGAWIGPASSARRGEYTCPWKG